MTTSNAPRSNGEIPNRMLRSLPTSEYEALMPHLELMRLRMGRIVYDQGQEMDHVYFPCQFSPCFERGGLIRRVHRAGIPPENRHPVNRKKIGPKGS